MKTLVLALSSLFAAAPAWGQYLATVVAGGAELTAAANNVPATSVPLDLSGGLAVDSAGNVYVTHSGPSLLLKISPAGVLAFAAGNPNVSGLSGDGGPAAGAELNDPTGVAIDIPGNLYIADSSNNLIRKISVDGTITTIAGVTDLFYSNQGFSGDAGPAQYALLNDPIAVAVDRTGNVYFSDYGNCRVRKIDTSGIINTFAGNGQCAYSGDGGPATSAAVFPHGVAVDAAGNVYIADYGNQRIRKVDGSGKITTIAGSGVAGASGDGGLASGAQLNWPAGVSVDAAGDIYIADTSNNRIRKIASNGVITTVAGNGQGGFSGDGGQATSASLVNPQAAVVDSSGNTYIAEGGHVRKVSPDGTISTFAGQTASDYSNGSLAASLQIGQTTSVAAAPDGSFYVAASQIFKVSSAGILSPVTGAVGGFLALDSSGTLYIANAYSANAYSSQVQKVSSSGVVSTIAGNGSQGYSGDGGPATAAQLNLPQGLAVDRSGNVYIADSLNHRVRMVTPQGTISTVAGTGQPGFSGDSGLATAAQLSDPSGLAFDSAGNLYIVDSTVFGQTGPAFTNQRIRKVDTTGVITTVAGNGIGGYGGDGGLATSALLCFPQSVTVDANGNLFILDSGNQVVRKVDTTGTISTAYLVNGGGQVSLYLSVADYLKAGGGISVDGNGSLYIADVYDGIVLKASPITATHITGVVNAANFVPQAAPGSLLTVFGVNLAANQSSPAQPLPPSVGDTSVSFDNLPAPLLYVSPSQINLQVPFEAPVGAGTLTVSRTSTGSAAMPVTVVAASPAIFRLAYGVAAITNMYGVWGDPVPRGTYISIYCTGLADVTNRPASGAPAPPGLPYSETLLTPAVTIGGLPATVSFSGLAPNYVGLYQVNVLVPANAPVGDAIQLIISVGAVSDMVIIGVQ